MRERVGVEHRDDLEAVFAKLLIAEEGGAEVAGAEEEGAVAAVVAEGDFDAVEELGDGEADAAASDDGDGLEVFADEGGVEGEVAADGGAGDELGAGGLEVAEVAVVAGHPSEGGLGDGGFDGALHIEKTLSRRGYRENPSLIGV